MRKIIMVWVIFLVVSFSIGVIGKKVYTYYNQHPIKAEYPFPNFIADNQWLHDIDDMFMTTACFAWYKVKEIKTGEEYYVKVGGKGIKVRRLVMKSKWETLTLQQYNKRFKQPWEGITQPTINWTW